MGVSEMLPRRVFHVKPGLCPTIKYGQDSKLSRRHRRSTSLDTYHDNCSNMGPRSNSISCLEMRENLVIPEPTKASRPIDLNQLFPEREMMDVSGVEVVRSSENPIIVITEDPDTQYEGDEDDSDLGNGDSEAESVLIETEANVNSEQDNLQTSEVERIETNEKVEGIENNEKVERIETSEKVEVESKEEELETKEIAHDDEVVNTEASSEVEVENLSLDKVISDENTISTEETNNINEREIPSENTDVALKENDIPVVMKETTEEKREILNENIKKNDEKQQEPKPESIKVKNTDENQTIDRELIAELVNLQRGWFDSNIRKQIKPTPKGWQLIHV